MLPALNIPASMNPAALGLEAPDGSSEQSSRRLFAAALMDLMLPANGNTISDATTSMESLFCFRSSKASSSGEKKDGCCFRLAVKAIHNHDIINSDKNMTLSDALLKHTSFDTAACVVGVHHEVRVWFLKTAYEAFVPMLCVFTDDNVQILAGRTFHPKFSWSKLQIPLCVAFGFCSARPDTEDAREKSILLVKPRFNHFRVFKTLDYSEKFLKELEVVEYNIAFVPVKMLAFPKVGRIMLGGLVRPV